MTATLIDASSDASSDASNAYLIDAKNLNSFYGQSHVLRGLSFSLRRGETVGLMGRNGMGKSTLLKTLMGLVRTQTGQILVQGQDMTAAPTHAIAMQGVAYVPEGRGIFGNLSVRENLVMAERAGIRGQRDWTFERVMATFPRLSERLQHGGQNLSGGEQQMLTIGRALMTNPDVLILDEATEGLAPLIAQDIWRICATVRDGGVSCVIVDKNYRQLCRIASRCLILVKGRVAFEGSSADLLGQPEVLSQHLGV